MQFHTQCQCTLLNACICTTIHFRLVSQCAFLCAEGDEEKKRLMDDKHPDYSKSNVDFVTMIMSS